MVRLTGPPDRALDRSRSTATRTASSPPNSYGALAIRRWRIASARLGELYSFRVIDRPPPRSAARKVPLPPGARRRWRPNRRSRPPAEPGLGDPTRASVRIAVGGCIIGDCGKAPQPPATAEIVEQGEAWAAAPPDCLTVDSACGSQDELAPLTALELHSPRMGPSVRRVVNAALDEGEEPCHLSIPRLGPAKHHRLTTGEPTRVVKVTVCRTETAKFGADGM